MSTQQQIPGTRPVAPNVPAGPDGPPGAGGAAPHDPGLRAPSAFAGLATPAVRGAPPGPPSLVPPLVPPSVPPGVPPGVPPPAAGVPGAAPAPAPRTRWLALTTTATIAALVASLATAGLTGALDGDAAPVGKVAAADQGTTADAADAPVTGSTSDQPDWQAVAAAVRASVVAIDVRTAGGGGKGSGVILDAEGHVLTNDHVVGDALEDGLQVTLADGRVFAATIVGLDPTTDLAVIKLTDPPADLEPATTGDSDAVEVGAAVMAVGNPLGLSSTATTGIISALDRPVSTSDGQDQVVTNAIQIDAAINPGNSGGPLFDSAGRVIGITSSIASLPGASGTSGGSIGLGFAIPVNQASRIADELIADGAAEHAFLGVGLGDGTATAEGTTRRGAVVQEVTADSPATRAGLEVGDVVVGIGDEPVSGAEALTAFVREQTAGSTAVLAVVRAGESIEVEVTFAVREETLSP